MSKAAHIAKAFNDLNQKLEELNYDDGIVELIDGGIKYIRNHEDLKDVSFTTEYNGEVIDLGDIKFNYERLDAEACYYAEIGDEVIGISGSYDSWNGTEWDDKTIKVGKLHTYTHVMFH